MRALCISTCNHFHMRTLLIKQCCFSTNNQVSPGWHFPSFIHLSFFMFLSSWFFQVLSSWHYVHAHPYFGENQGSPGYVAETLNVYWHSPGRPTDPCVCCSATDIPLLCEEEPIQIYIGMYQSIGNCCSYE